MATATDSTRTPDGYGVPTPTRRGLLGRMAAAAPLAALAGAPALAAEAPDPHEALERELVALTDWYNGPASVGLSDEERAPHFDRLMEMEERLHLTPARTLDGARAQLRNMVREQRRSALSTVQEDGLAVTLATLDALAGRA